jgi:ABC-2 type transport system ATP-binding protein
MHSTKGNEMHLAEPTISGRRPELQSIDGLDERAGTLAVEVSQLRKTYPGGVEAVKGIDFDVAPGEVFGLLGPNGAGKSTTIGMLTTTVRPTSGSARLAGYDVARQPLLARSVSSVVFQDPVVDGALSGRANLELHARLWGVPAAQANRRIAELVEAVGLAELIERPVSSYSGGQRRRLEIARALVSAPRVLFLDEPTVGLDPRIRHELLDVIVGLRNREDMTILVTTHYLDEAQRLCDRVAIIHQGEIVALDSPSALLAGLGREILEFRVDGSPATAVGALRDRGVARGDSFAIGARVTVPLHEHAATEAIAAIEAEGLRVSEIVTRIPTLDDVYLQLTGARMDEAA